MYFKGQRLGTGVGARFNANLIFRVVMGYYVHICVASEMQDKRQENVHLKVVRHTISPVYTSLD